MSMVSKMFLLVAGVNNIILYSNIDNLVIYYIL